MKKILFLLVLTLSIVELSQAQDRLKPHLKDIESKPNSSEIRTLQLKVNPVAVPRVQRPLQGTIRPNAQGAVLPSLERNTQMQFTRDVNGQVIFIEGKVEGLEAIEDGKESDYFQQALDYLEAIKEDLLLAEPEEEFSLQAVQKDELGQVHTRLLQMYQGLEVYGGELILHNRGGHISRANGRYYPTPSLEDVQASVSEMQAISTAKHFVSKQTTIKELDAEERKLLHQAPEQADLVIFHMDRKLDAERLCWKVDIVPHIGQHWLVFVDAKTGEIVHQFDQICRFHDHSHTDGHHNCSHEHETTTLLDGPATANATDLNGITRTINTYESSGNYFMVDASRPMFSSFQSNVIEEPRGAIWTLDAQNSSPQGNFQVFHNASGNNTWSNRTAVSAHYNAGVAYEYFRTTFNRNSIDGSGGTIISIINVTDQDGSQMDNAFWHDKSMYYGNGAQAFDSPLAKAVDVAGHEMSHGVIQNTANLEYYAESGALNESFADIFGVMMDREDWQIGEDVVNTNIFRTGTMRDMRDPNNGGSRLGDVGWQPAHTDEQFFGREDNAGVHINSGIVNRAFYLFASNSSVGKAKAEQVYYRALTRYLTRSSNFIDARLAVIQAAKDLHGNNSSEVTAVENAFTSVGIRTTGGGGGGDTDGSTNVVEICNLDINPGTERVILTDGNDSQLYLADGEGNLLQNPLVDVAIKSKPSITDDGSFVVFVDANSALRFIDFNRGELGFLEENNPNPNWRNAAISKDGQLLAALTDDFSNPEILVFNLTTGNGQAFPLSNPTTAQGIATGDVQYADAMEWSYDGEFLIYDALSAIPNSFGEDIEYWNINFLQAWDRGRNSFSDGLILPLFGGLPDGVSIGNPTFAKNSSCIIAFDFLDENSNTVDIYGVNYETGDVSVIFEGNTAGFPNYTKNDDALIFDFIVEDTETRILGMQNVNNDKITPSGEAFLFLEGGSWGVVFADGVRQVTNTTQIGEHEVKVFPTIFDEQITIEWEGQQATDAQVELFDALGRRLMVQALQSNMQLSTSSLPAGAYFLKVQIGTQYSTQQLIKVQ